MKAEAQIPDILWPARALPSRIAGPEVHAWAWSFGESSEMRKADMQLLDEEERARCRRFRFLSDRVRFSVCHANMRRILGSYMDTGPEAIQYETGPHGKPELARKMECSLKFNLSHSKRIGVLAVARNAEVGVDVEDIRPIESGVAESHFSARELGDLRTLDGREWLAGFYRCWTRKEAVLKAEGAGLRIPLDSFDVSLLPGSDAELLASRPEAKLQRRWQLHALVPSANAIGALAIDRPEMQLTLSEYRL